jgi:hypothetical protein
MSTPTVIISDKDTIAKVAPCCLAESEIIRHIMDGIFPSLAWFAKLIEEAKSIGLDLNDTAASEATVLVHQVKVHKLPLNALVTALTAVRATRIAETKKSEAGPCAGCGLDDVPKRRFGNKRVVLCSNCFTKEEFRPVLEEEAMRFLSRATIVPIDVGKILATTTEDACEQSKKAINNIIRGGHVSDELQERTIKLATEKGLDKFTPPLNIAQMMEAMHHIAEHNMPVDEAVEHARDLPPIKLPH